MNNSSGKVLTVFLFIIAILLISITAIAVFFFLKEVEVRKAVEYNLQQMQMKEASVEQALSDTEKKVTVYEDKMKELQIEIDNLQGELDLAEGVRDEVKKENQDLKNSLTKSEEEKTALKGELDKKLAEAEAKATSLQDEIKTAVDRNKELDKLRQEFEDKYLRLKKQLEDGGITPNVEEPTGDEEEMGETLEESASESKDEVDLEKIVVSPVGEQGEGKVVSVDTESDFVIVNLGEKEGVAVGTILSIYRGNDYIGDIKVSRVLPEMSAADLVPPLQSVKINKDDKVIIKK